MLEKLVVMVEEPSMEAALERLLPTMLGDVAFQIIRFQCKDDLLKQLPQRLMGYAQWLPDTAKVLVIVDRDDDDCLQLKDRLEQMARSMDPRVKQVMAGLAAEYDVMYVARRDGTHAADVRPLVRLSVTVIAEHQGRREQGSAGGGGRFDLAFFTDEVLHDYARKAVDQALVNLEARPAPAGQIDRKSTRLNSSHT